MNPHNSLIYYDEYSIQRNTEMRDFMQNTFVTALLESVQEQCILVLWGDGAMLRAIGEHADKNIPFLGLNFWHKGFLLNHVNWVYPEIPEFIHRSYPLLDIELEGSKLGSAFNDVHLYSPEWKALSLQVRNDFWTLELWWDGMILATPAGSTWHSKSYGGPILPHKSENLVITPKGNITPQTSKALDDNHTIEIKNTGRKYPLAINIDGQQIFVSKLDQDVSLEIKKSSSYVQLLIAKNHLQDWDNKVMAEQGFKV